LLSEEWLPGVWDYGAPGRSGGRGWKNCGMDSEILWRVAVVQALAVFVLALALAIVFSHGFFTSWGWIVGPLAWLGCARFTAWAVGLPVAPVMVRAVGAGLVSAIFVIFGQHWLGAAVAIAILAISCARLPRAAAGDAR
jgi:hypothetical protein